MGRHAVPAGAVRSDRIVFYKRENITTNRPSPLVLLCTWAWAWTCIRGCIRENKSPTRRTFVVGAIRAHNNKDDNNAHRLAQRGVSIAISAARSALPRPLGRPLALRDHGAVEREGGSARRALDCKMILYVLILWYMLLIESARA